MKYKILFGLIYIIAAASCNKPHVVRPGIYTNNHYTILQKSMMALNYNVTTIATGSDLKINPDSTFIYTACGIVHKGNWEQTGDSLVLFIREVGKEKSKTGESTDIPKLPESPVAFRISGNRLEQMSRNRVNVLEYKVEKENS